MLTYNHRQPACSPSNKYDTTALVKSYLPSVSLPTYNAFVSVNDMSAAPLQAPCRHLCLLTLEYCVVVGVTSCRCRCRCRCVDVVVVVVVYGVSVRFVRLAVHVTSVRPSVRPLTSLTLSTSLAAFASLCVIVSSNVKHFVGSLVRWFVRCPSVDFVGRSLVSFHFPQRQRQCVRGPAGHETS